MLINKIIFSIAFCVGLVLIGCPKQTTIPVQQPTDTDWCEPGCKHLQTLTGRDGNPACEEARALEMPNGEQVTCIEFCKQTQNARRSLYPSCWVKATKCEQIEEFRKRTVPCEGH